MKTHDMPVGTTKEITKGMGEKKLVFRSDVKLVGVLRYPEGDFKEKLPAVLLNHGTLEQDRDGNILRHPDGRKVPRRDFFLEISRHFCSAGFATFSWDKRGVRESEAGRGETERSETGESGTLAQVRDSEKVLEMLCAQETIDETRIAVYGQSAGVYTSCLLAKNLLEKSLLEKSDLFPIPKAFILSGGLYRDCAEMIAFNYRRPVDYARKSPEHRKWVEENDLFGLVLGSNLDLRKKALREGKTGYKIEYGGREWTIPLDPLFADPGYAPSKQFRYIRDTRRPVLVIHGDCDLNVPVEDAYMAEKELRGRGPAPELAIIRGVDHSFQEVPADGDERLRERMSLECFKRPYRQEYFDTMTDFLRRVL